MCFNAQPNKGLTFWLFPKVHLDLIKYQTLRRFPPKIMFKIREEIEKLLKNKFIRTAKYVKWLANIVSVIKNNETLRVYINFRDLNTLTPKDEYPMSTA